MAATLQITYLFDPLCGWCYGASGAIERLAQHPDFTITMAPTGLFADSQTRVLDDAFAAYAWENDQRIEQLSGQEFSDAYRRDVLDGGVRSLDSGPATRALTAVALTAPEREIEALRAIQKARYVDGKDITDTAVLSDVLRGLQLPEAADRQASPNADLLAAYAKRVDAARADMRHFFINGVPVLIVGAGDNRNVVSANAFIGDEEGLVAALKVSYFKEKL